MTTLTPGSVAAADAAGSTDDVLAATRTALALMLDDSTLAAYARVNATRALLAVVREQNRRAEAAGGKTREADEPDDELAALRRKAGLR